MKNLNRNLDAAAGSLLARLPATLYRYCGVSGERLGWIERLLIQSEAYFTPASTFNDPIDCKIPFNFNSSRLKIEQYWRSMERQQGVSRQEHKRRIRQLVIQSKTADGQKRLTELQFKGLERHGILCLSTEPDDMLMWSYYADGHKGIVVRFNTSLEQFAILRPQYVPVEVKYSMELPRIDYYETETQDMIARVVGTKAKAWEHEKEWRIVLVNQTGYVHIPPTMITAVIFGLRTEAASERRIREWTERREIPLQFFRIRNLENSFQLEVVSA